MDERLLTMKEAAKVVGASLSTFCEKYEAWGLEPVYLPNLTYNKRWAMSELQRFIEARKVARAVAIEKKQRAERKGLRLVRARRRA